VEFAFIQATNIAPARLHDSASPAGPARCQGPAEGAPEPPANRRQAEGDDGLGGMIPGRGRPRGEPPRRRLGHQPQRREKPSHRMGFGHRAEDPPPTPAAIAHQHGGEGQV